MRQNPVGEPAATAASEAVTVLGKRWVPPLLENLQQGLLDQSVDDARYAELSDPAVRLGYFDPLDRLRLVGSREQLSPHSPDDTGFCGATVLIIA